MSVRHSKCTSAAPNGQEQQEFLFLLRHFQIGQDRQSTCDVTLKCCCSKANNIIYSECVSVALITQHAKPMRRIILSSMACLPVQYFSILSDIRQDFREKSFGNAMCVVIFFKALSEICLTLRIIRPNIIINVHMSSPKSPVNELEFS